MKLTVFYAASASLFLTCILGCEPKTTGSSSSTAEPPQTATSTAPTPVNELFQVEAEQFADFQILRYQVPGFEQLDLKTKTLLYYLAQASLAGRDIMWDQNYRYNLTIRELLEGIIRFYPGDRNAESFQNILLYTKQMWAANGIHHHYSNDKFTPKFTAAELSTIATVSQKMDGFPLSSEELKARLSLLEPIFFDPTIDAKKVNKSEQADKVADSAVNFYRNLTEAEVTDFYAAQIDNDDATPISHGLNSQLVKEDGKIVERVWKEDGMYGSAISTMTFWLEKALTVTENAAQHDALSKLITFYRSGELRDFDDYSIAWVKDSNSHVDLIHGFIEVYNDPLAYRGSFEAVLSVVDPIATARIGKLADEAQWFEDNSPIMDAHKKANVKGISARAINVVMEVGDASPTTPIGINLPNANWIRAEHGSKSVNLSNIVAAYDAVGGETVKEFGYSDEEKERAKKYAQLASKLHTDLHEVIGHASGKLNPGVGTPKQTLKQYGSTLEEGRADLVALYFAYDQKLIELGIMPNMDVAKAEYDRYIRNGLMTQLYRIQPGKDIEEDHMRNRQLIAQWAFTKGKTDKVIERKEKNGKTFFVVNDYLKLRKLFGELLREMQRIKSEGDYAAARELVETYGVKVDEELHQEVLARYKTLNVPPYSGFINPTLVVHQEGDEITDVTIEYSTDFATQMLEYSRDWSLLPLENL